MSESPPGEGARGGQACLLVGPVAFCHGCLSLKGGLLLSHGRDHGSACRHQRHDGQQDRPPAQASRITRLLVRPPALRLSLSPLLRGEVSCVLQLTLLAIPFLMLLLCLHVTRAPIK